MTEPWTHDRIIGVVGTPGSGASTLVAALAHAIGEAAHTSGPVTILPWQGSRLALIDGLPAEELVHAVDALVLVVSSPDGVDTALSGLWHRCDELRLPRLVVVTKLDHERADMDETVAVLRRVLSEGPELLRLTMPVLDDDEGLGGFIDLATTEIWDWTAPELARRACDPEHLALIGEAREELIADLATLSEDPRLAASLGLGLQPGLAQVTEALAATSRTGHLQLVVGTGRSAHGFVGAELVLDLLATSLPAPAERPSPVVVRADGSAMLPIEPQPQGPLVATVVHVDAQEGAFVRVFAGGLGHEVSIDGRVSATHVSVEAITPQLAWVKSGALRIGQTLSSPDLPLRIEGPMAH